MFHLSCRHADKINLLPYRIPLAKIYIGYILLREESGSDPPEGPWGEGDDGRTFQCVYGAAGDVSNPVLV